MSKTEFLQKIAPVIERIAKARGYGAYSQAIIAQAGCESNWGKSSLASKFHNYFGMKAGKSWKGTVAELVTREEYVKGELTTITAKFRAYGSLEDGINGYFDFIESYKRYQNLKKATDAYDYIKKLKSDGWATSSAYVETLTKIMEGLKNETNPATVNPKPCVSDDNGLRRIALDVIRGKYGNGSIRRLRLSQAGYDYRAVQAEVNKILSGK